MDFRLLNAGNGSQTLYGLLLQIMGSGYSGFFAGAANGGCFGNQAVSNVHVFSKGGDFSFEEGCKRFFDGSKNTVSKGFEIRIVGVDGFG